jgi:hypothetical protein
MSLHIFFLFSIFLVYALARDWFRYNRHAAIGITALYGLSPVMYYTIYHGYQGQMIATGLALCMFLVHFEAISNCQKISHYYTYFPLAVLLNWGVSLTYPQMLSFIYAPIAVYLLLVASYKRSRSLALRWIYFVLITLVITFILSPDRAKVLVSSLILKSRANFGWFIPWISPDTFFGLTTMKNFSLQSHTGPMRYILSTPLIIIMALGFVNTYKADGKLFLLAGSSVFVIVIGSNS